ncbi:unnamed protein product [Eruca vesicaria subsp. sativa]|uniref:Uncharacterized protein n=1 Tax=Eruca vesicaria subsp. sativa TaxID=29727 RepID=A0ABC8JI72_ERUVS|nr:unnamed protein product [Eruca vesicaria subsp. sativa]
MAANQDYGSSLANAFTNGMNDRSKPYRALLKMYREYHEAVVARHNAEVEVYRILGKLELLEDLFND